MKYFRMAEIEFVYFDTDIDVITDSSSGKINSNGEIETPWDFDDYGLDDYGI